MYGTENSYQHQYSDIWNILKIFFFNTQQLNLRALSTFLFEICLVLICIYIADEIQKNFKTNE